MVGDGAGCGCLDGAIRVLMYLHTLPRPARLLVTPCHVFCLLVTPVRTGTALSNPAPGCGSTSRPPWTSYRCLAHLLAKSRRRGAFPWLPVWPSLLLCVGWFVAHVPTRSVSETFGLACGLACVFCAQLAAPTPFRPPNTHSTTDITVRRSGCRTSRYPEMCPLCSARPRCEPVIALASAVPACASLRAALVFVAPRGHPYQPPAFPPHGSIPPLPHLQTNPCPRPQANLHVQSQPRHDVIIIS